MRRRARAASPTSRRPRVDDGDAALVARPIPADDQQGAVLGPRRPRVRPGRRGPSKTSDESCPSAATVRAHSVRRRHRRRPASGPRPRGRPARQRPRTVRAREEIDEAVLDAVEVLVPAQRRPEAVVLEQQSTMAVGSALQTPRCAIRMCRSRGGPRSGCRPRRRTVATAGRGARPRVGAPGSPSPAASRGPAPALAGSAQRTSSAGGTEDAKIRSLAMDEDREPPAGFDADTRGRPAPKPEIRTVARSPRRIPATPANPVMLHHPEPAPRCRSGAPGERKSESTRRALPRSRCGFAQGEVVGHEPADRAADSRERHAPCFPGPRRCEERVDQARDLGAGDVRRPSPRTSAIGNAPSAPPASRMAAGRR